MANGREALDVENQAEGSVTGQRALYDALIKGIHDERGKLKFHPIWSMIFVMSCVIAVLLDPLFLYILIIDEDNKCLQMDKKLSTIVLLLRSLTDIFFAVDFIYKTYDSVKVQMHKKLTANVTSNTLKLVVSSTLQTETSIQTGGNLDRKSEGRVFIEVGKKRAQMSWLSFSIINGFLALLPIPQLLIVATFHNMRGAEYVEHRKVLNVFILGQYLPRIYRIHQSSKEIRETTGIWFKGLFKFFLYISASHTLMMKSEEIGRKIRMKKLGVRAWISRNEFPDDIKNEIMNSTEQILIKNKDANVDNPFLILHWQTKRSVKRYLFMDTLKTVKMLKGMDERVLMLICDYLMPVTYGANNFIFRMGDPLDFMLFIIDGTMWSYASSDSQAGNGTSSMATEPLGKGQFYGEELLEWALDGFTKVPVSSKHVKSQTKVEAFVLMAKDLQTVVSRVKQYWDYHNCKNPEEVAISTIRRARFHVKAQRRLLVPRLR